jgi:hypothetical protein
MQIRRRLQIGPRECTVRLKQSILDIRPFCVHFYHKFRNLILPETSLIMLLKGTFLDSYLVFLN